MIILDTSTKYIVASTNSVHVTNPVTFIASYINIASLSISALSSNQGNLSNAETTIVDSPSESNQRQVKYINIFNNDTITHVLTIDYVNATSQYTLVKTSISPGHSLIYSNEGLWKIINSADITEELVTLTGVTVEPSSPASGDLVVYSKNIAGRMFLKIKGPSGLDVPLQSGLFANGIVLLIPASSAINIIGGPITNVGTVTTPVPSDNSFIESIRRWRIASAATANSAAESRTAIGLCFRGNAPGRGGFFYLSRWSISTTTSTQQAAIGLWNSTGATSLSITPSSIVNSIFFGWDAADNYLQVMHNDASGTCTKIDLGSNFPKNNLDAVYETSLFSPPNGDSIYYRVKRLDADFETGGEITTDIPAQNIFLTRHEYTNNGGTAASVSFEFSRVYIETDY